MEHFRDAPGLHEGPTPQKIAVLRALQLGDLLCLVPALRALRAAFPQAEITLIALPWAEAFVARFNRYVDKLIEFPGFPGLPERKFHPEAFIRFLQQAQSANFDLALQLHGSGKYTNTLIELLGARASYGFYSESAWCPNSERFMPYPAAEPEIRRHLRLIEFMGLPVQGEHLEFPLGDDDQEKLNEILLSASRLPFSRICCLHPGARSAARRWQPEKFAAVGDELSDIGLSVVISGTRDEAPLADAVQAHMRSKAVNLCGRTDLGSLGALIGRSTLLICNDTAVSHIAAALGTPSVVVFEGPELAAWPPLDRRRHRLICRLRPVDPADVLGEAADLLTTDTASSVCGPETFQTLPRPRRSNRDPHAEKEGVCRNSAS